MAMNSFSTMTSCASSTVTRDREARGARGSRSTRQWDANHGGILNNAHSTTSRLAYRDDLDARKAIAIKGRGRTARCCSRRSQDDIGKIWASVLKSAIKRRKPDFNESYYGFRAFGNLLEEAQLRGLLEVGRDEKSGSFVFRAQSVAATEPVRDIEAPVASKENRQAGNTGNDRNRRKGRNPRPQVSEPLFR